MPQLISMLIGMLIQMLKSLLISKTLVMCNIQSSHKLQALDTDWYINGGRLASAGVTFRY